MTRESGRGRSLGLKIFLVGALVIALGVPLALVNLLAWERQNRAHDVAVEVGDALGGAQTVRGPFLVVPLDVASVTETGRGEDVARTRTVKRQFVFVSPVAVDIAATLETRILRRAIYSVPAYRGVISLSGAFDLAGIEALVPANGALSWDEARVFVAVSDLRGISEDFEARVSVQTAPLRFEPGLPIGHNVEPYSASIPSARGISAAVSGLSERSVFTFDGELVLTGARAFALQPSGQETTVRIHGDWPHPGFDGAYLPGNREISVDGFSAEWFVPYLARGFPARWIEGQGYDLSNSHQAVLAVNLISPADGYARVSRSLKYAFFFVGFTLLMFFLIETRSPRRLHAAQYILIGMAQIVFYLLLLALSEHAGVGLAFAGASGATILLTALYAWSAYRDNASAIFTFGALTASYATLFLLVLMEDYALLLGSALAFLAVAVTMYVTRRIDWYGSEIRKS